MPTLSHHQSNEYTKLLIEGDSGSGKTGAITSLVKDGFKVRILDMDNGLETLKQFVLRECPDRLDNVEFRTLRDKRVASPLGPIIQSPTAFVTALKMLDRWKYKDADGNEIDLGIPAEWGPDCILVLDSLTFLSDAAFDFRESLTVSSSKDGKYDKRAVYKDAQDAIESVIALLTSENFRTNVIVISHVRYVDNPDGTRKGYPSSVGSALSPLIPRYFNTVALCQTSAGGKRTIQTVATPMIDLKNPKPFAMGANYPLETGLSQIFHVLRDNPAKEPAPAHEAPPAVAPTTKPTKLTLKRIGT